jgi:predicted RNA-binding Zn-ribbon protein involved in translation (DUF1610 family)
VSGDAQLCAVCGRTILSGERTRTFMSPKEGQKLVCDLCRERARGLGWVDPTAPGATVGRRPAPEVSESPTNRLERAALRFNGSEASRTVGGLMRTLGRPSVSVGSAAGSPSEVRITFAWDLCWYQWGVDLGDDLRPVFQIDRGTEIEQLDGSARQWNASAGEGGRISVGVLAREPVG